MDIKFGKLIFKSNGILASGILGVTGHSMLRVAVARPVKEMEY